jgi:hypothetical protein
MTIGRDIVGNLAKQFGYSKELVRQALASNQIDPLTASLVGSRIDKMQQTKQEAASRTTVMEDVLAPKPEEVMGQGIAAIPQEAPSALAALPSNLPAQEMAGGGIIAFAEGGETPEPSAPAQPSMSIAPPKGYTFDQVSGQYDKIRPTGLGGINEMLFSDEGILARLMGRRGYAEGGELDLDDDEDEGREKSTLSQLMGGLSSGLAGLRRAIPDSSGISIPKSYEGALAEKGQTPATVRKMMMEGPKKGDYVMPPIEASETTKRGGHKYEDAVVREAERLGVDPKLALHVLYKETGNLKNPETARSKAGAIGVMQLMPKTAKGLGVDPMNPEENIRGGITYLKQMMDQFNDPTLALAAYNAGPGRVNQILRSGRGIEALPRETQNYIRMAEGGIVAFANGGLGGEFGGSGGDQEESVVVDPYFVIDPMTKQPVPSGYRKTVPKSEARPEAIINKTTPAKPDTSPLPAMGPTDEELGRFAPSPTPQDQIEKLVSGTQGGGEKEKSMMDRYMSLLEGREKSSADQRKQDAYLSLLSAGLGMMGGTSPFAAVNIGQGAQAGIAAQAAARKTQAAEEAATLKGFGTAAAAEEYAKQRQLVAAQAQEAKIPQQLANIRRDVIKNIVAVKKLDIADPVQLAEVERLADAAIAKDAGYQSLYSKLYGGKFTPAPVTGPAVDYGKTYGLTPKPTK